MLHPLETSGNVAGPALAVFGVVAAMACGRDVPRYDLDAGFGSADPKTPSMVGRIVTSNNGDDSLSVIDPGSLGPAIRVPVGLVPIEPEGPHHVSASPDGAFVYVNLSYSVVAGGGGPHGTHGTGTMQGFVLKLSTADGRLIAKSAVETNPGENLLSADGGTLYVTHYDLAAWVTGVRNGDLRQGDSALLAIDTASMQTKWRLPICPAAHGARLSLDQQTLFAACGPDEIAVVDLTATPPSVRRVPLPGLGEADGCLRCPYALAVAPDGTVWVASLGPSSGRTGDGGVDVFDPALAPSGAGQPSGGFDPTRSIQLSRGRAMFPTFVVNPKGYRAYVPQQGPAGDRLRAYDVEPGGGAPLEAGALSFGRETCLNAHMVTIDESAGRAYVVCEGDHLGPGALAVLDLATLTLTRSIPLGVFPDGMAIVPAPLP